MPLKICLLSDHHLSINPRLWKEAFFYEKQGYEVVILSTWQSANLLEKDREILKGHAISYKAYLNLLPGEINKAALLFYRVRKRVAAELQKRLHVGIQWAISYAPELMYQQALKENADLYAAHLECAFYAGKKLLKAGKRVCFDFEDWYSRDYLVPARPVGLLSSLEKFALNNGLFCTTTSKAMAEALKDAYRINKEITVIYNGFSINESVERKESQQNNNYNAYTKIIWFSRTIGSGRGIELMLKALMVCEIPVELHVLGEMKAGYKEFLEKEFSLIKQHRLVIHRFMSHALLLNFIAQFQIGLAIEENINDNKSLTISNKILQYLQAGLPVIASDTKGQKEVAEFFPSMVTIVDINDPAGIADTIRLLSTKEINEQVGQKEQFERIFSWEAQEKKLNSLLERNLWV